MNDWAELGHASEPLPLLGPQRFARMENLARGTYSASLRVARSKARVLSFTWWSDRRNLTRRVLPVRERTPNRIVLEVQRFGRAKPGRLESMRAHLPRPAKRVTREQFCAGFTRTLAERFPDATVDSLRLHPISRILFPEFTRADACMKDRAPGR